MTHHLSRRGLLKAGTAAAVSLSLSCNSRSGRTEAPRKSIDLEEQIMIPEGQFLMGTSEKQIQELAKAYGYHRSWFSSEAPQRKVFLPGFRIDKYPVTNSRFARFCKSANYPGNAVWKNEKVAKLLPDHPVTGITWREAAEYARWKEKRLPTEAEWEKAARGTRGCIFPWGDQFNPDACVWNRSHIIANPTDAVYAHPEGASA